MSRERPTSMRDLGDFQTPTELVAAIVERLRRTCGGSWRWRRVLEPTCGRGRFLAAVLDQGEPPFEVRGIEIQPGHHAEATALAESLRPGVTFEVALGNLFDRDLRRVPSWTADGSLLVLGNPPWVTSAELGVLNSQNHPRKQNRMRSRGIDAITGSANFDLAEAVWLKLLDELTDQAPTIALLGKLSVARRVLEHAARSRLPVADAWLAMIDARAWFGASVEAALLCITLGGPETAPGLPGRIPVYPDLTAVEPCQSIGLARGTLVSDVDRYRAFAFADGECRLQWRQGVKHDAAAVMELTAEGPSAPWRNGLGEVVDVEPSHVYPLLKGGDLPRADSAPRRGLIVTQRRTGEDTTRLASEAPRLWSYLNRHEDAFTRRRSTVYRDAAPFAIFGVGPYTFAPCKVAVSALHRRPVFRALGPVEGRPVVLDDTCYLLPFEDGAEAAQVAAALNGPAAIGLLGALSTPGAKRAVTKATLQRLDLDALRQNVPA